MQGTIQRTQGTLLNPPQTPKTFTRCVVCRCTNCIQIKADTKSVKEDITVVKKMLEKLSSTKISEVSTDTTLKTVNLCGQDLPEELELSINYAYKDSGRQLMILDCGAPVSLAGISWMEQYLQEFNLTIDQMSSTTCNQPFVFGPSRR